MPADSTHRRLLVRKDVKSKLLSVFISSGDFYKKNLELQGVFIAKTDERWHFVRKARKKLIGVKQQITVKTVICSVERVRLLD